MEHSPANDRRTVYIAMVSWYARHGWQYLGMKGKGQSDTKGALTGTVKRELERLARGMVGTKGKVEVVPLADVDRPPAPKSPKPERVRTTFGEVRVRPGESLLPGFDPVEVPAERHE